MTNKKFKRAVELLHECYMALQIAQHDNSPLGIDNIELIGNINNYFNNNTIENQYYI